MTTSEHAPLQDQLRQQLTDALVDLGVDRARAIGLLALHVRLGVVLRDGGRAFAQHADSTCEADPAAVAAFARYLLGALPPEELGGARRAAAPSAPTAHTAHRRHVTSAF